jgi:hypothetical protein
MMNMSTTSLFLLAVVALVAVLVTLPRLRRMRIDDPRIGPLKV